MNAGSRFIKHLPETYQEEGPAKEWLERFLCIFESVWQSCEETITAVPGYFDPLTAPEDFIPWLAQWLSLDLYELLGEKNREFILRAFDFYKGKGTVAGIEDLVTFLTGIEKCRVKEYTHNIFRCAGLEPRMLGGDLKAAGVTAMSRSVDTSDRGLLSRMATYYDEVHYVTDTDPAARYTDRVVGLYIFLSPGEREFVIKEDQLHKIIDSFLPVFVRAEINIVEGEWATEVYSLNRIGIGYRDRLRTTAAESVTALQGEYSDSANWSRILSYSHDPVGCTNNLKYRTFHTEIGVTHSF